MAPPQSSGIHNGCGKYLLASYYVVARFFLEAQRSTSWSNRSGPPFCDRRSHWGRSMPETPLSHIFATCTSFSVNMMSWYGAGVRVLRHATREAEGRGSLPQAAPRNESWASLCFQVCLRLPDWYVSRGPCCTGHLCTQQSGTLASPMRASCPRLGKHFVRIIEP